MKKHGAQVIKMMTNMHKIKKCTMLKIDTFGCPINLV